MSLHAEDRTAYNAYTGVACSHRGRRLGLALKVRAAIYALENGVRSLSTDKDSQNTHILAINRKLGYQPEPGRYILVGEVMENDAHPPGCASFYFRP